LDAGERDLPRAQPGANFGGYGGGCKPAEATVKLTREDGKALTV
jgi:hypothetical protein